MEHLSYKQEQQLFNIANNLQSHTLPSGEDVAFITLMRICRDYVDYSRYPLIMGASRDEWFFERIKKYHIRFFDKI